MLEIFQRPDFFVYSEGNFIGMRQQVLQIGFV